MSAIFVETTIEADLERVWHLTQDPAEHQRWDPRFSTIEYLPKAKDSDPQRFLYSTHIGFGLPISGEGESVGERLQDGKRTSALKFWSEDKRSLILEGSGYWQYEPTERGTDFRTRYDYRVRYGALGRALDLVFRPLIGWATAWGFDALRLWAERDIPPEASIARGLIHLACRSALALTWFYQGLVPKILYPELGERDVALRAGAPTELVDTVLIGAGVAEMLLAVAVVVFWRWRPVLLWQSLLPILLPLPLLWSAPDLFGGPFNPAALAFCMAGLGVAGWMAAKDMPSAKNCLRKPR